MQLPGLLSERGELFMVTVAENDPHGRCVCVRGGRLCVRVHVHRPATQEALQTALHAVVCAATPLPPCSSHSSSTYLYVTCGSRSHGCCGAWWGPCVCAGIIQEMQAHGFDGKRLGWSACLMP